MRTVPITCAAQASGALAAGDAGVGGGGCYGFMVEPAGSTPGGYPLNVYVDDRSTDPLIVSSDRPFYFSQPVQQLKISGGTPGGTYTLQLAGKGEAFGPSGRRGRQQWNVIPSGNAPTAAPVNGARPASALVPNSSWRNILVCTSSAAGQITVYQQTEAGNWYASQVLAGAGVWSLDVAFAGGAIYLQAAAAATPYEVDVEAEIG